MTVTASFHSYWVNKDQAACKPGSVQGLATRGRPFLWDAPRGTPRATNPDGARRRACRTSPGGLARRPSLFGLAPGGACLAIPVTRDAVGSYPTLSPLPGSRSGRFAFCGAIPRVTLLNPFGSGRFPGRTLSAALPTWSPDFPPAVACQRSPGRLIREKPSRSLWVRRWTGWYWPEMRPKRRMAAITALGHGLFRYGRLKSGPYDTWRV